MASESFWLALSLKWPCTILYILRDFGPFSVLSPEVLLISGSSSVVRTGSITIVLSQLSCSVRHSRTEFHSVPFTSVRSQLTSVGAVTQRLDRDIDQEKRSRYLETVARELPTSSTNDISDKERRTYLCSILLSSLSFATMA